MENRRPNRGFALIATLSVLILLALIAVGLLSLSTVSLRSAKSDRAMQEARANARMALVLAIAELQKTAGHDQRVTAPADIVMDPAAGDDSRRHWIGVWDTSTYNPNPTDSANHNKDSHFKRWLVSAVESGNTDAEAIVLSDPLTIFDGKGLSENVVVDKIKVGLSNSNNSAYAYWVEDNGLKAPVVWNESLSSDSLDKQAADLAVSRGPNFSVFTGIGTPFDDTLTDSFILNIDKVTSINDLSLANNKGAISDFDQWVKEKRHDLTALSQGVLSDTKWGGLQRDLSLAFEMDGNAEAVDADKFNDQDGEFVRGGDRFEESSNAPSDSYANRTTPGMGSTPGKGPLKARHVHRDFKDSGTPFSADIGVPVWGGHSSSLSEDLPAILRGPTWWNIRDYALLYKKVTGASGAVTLSARAYFPNSDDDAILSERISPINRSSLWDTEVNRDQRQVNINQNYLFRPASASYAPVSLGVSSIMGAKKDGDQLVLTLDMILYFWNPYNVSISYDNLVVSMDAGLPGSIGIWITKSGEDDTLTYHNNLVTHLKNNLDNVNKINFLIPGAVLEPGEVVLASPDNTGVAALEFGLTTDSGISMRKLESPDIESESEVPPLAADDQVGFLYQRDNVLTRIVGYETDNAGNLVLDDEGNPIPIDSKFTGGMRHDIQLFLPKPGTTPDLNNPATFGDELQLLHFPDHGDKGAGTVFEYRSPEVNKSSKDPVKTIRFGDLEGKMFFGINTNIMKPANWSGSAYVSNDGSSKDIELVHNPVEVFSRFNPMPTVVKREYSRICALNQMHNFITHADSDTLLNGFGINFSATTDRNAFWGESFSSTASTHVPFSSIPTSPLFSLAQLSHGNFSLMAADPAHAIGNSWSSPLIPEDSVYGYVDIGGVGSRSATSPNSAVTGQDLSWLLNDALFDRYFFSGIVEDPVNEDLDTNLELFYGSSYRDAHASPVMMPYLPGRADAAGIVTDLGGANTDGYKKMAAYALLDGAFNVNSTSVEAWAALLQSAKDLEIEYSEGSDESSTGTPFPGSNLPSAGSSGTKQYWAGFSRLEESQILDKADPNNPTGLAVEIVRLIKENGPFMSLSDFVNRQMGDHKGLLQEAIDTAGINSDIHGSSGAGGTTPLYAGGPKAYFPDSQDLGPATTATGIAADINQAELLMPLAPRLRPRSDTFTIRTYGESVRNGVILAKAYCEAVVQRVPEYVDASQDPWQDLSATPLAYPKSKPEDSTLLNAVNKEFGRKFKTVSFRWLSNDEI